VAGGVPRRGGCILLVDDEATVLQATAIFLRVEGHEVITAGSPDEALAKLGRLDRAPDLIVSDFQLGLPVTGAELIERVRATVGRDIPAVVLSGDMLRVVRHCEHLANCRVFHKPVDAEELAQHLRATLEA
jgi:CheY-like chemotaxis protein